MTEQTEALAFQQVVELLRTEANAIGESAMKQSPEDVQRAVDFIARSKGKVILLGVGKSGIIAHKIAATMTSTGTAALSIHPTDAMHGDLGYISPNDVAVLISNSGETDELLALLPHLKRRSAPIIAIVGNPASTLARNADAVLDASVSKEACPLNLAPTASTTVSLALGDALAMAVMQHKGVHAEDFAFNHPAGQLGKRLTLQVQDLMHGGSANPIVQLEDSWIDVISALSEKGLGAVNVVDKQMTLLGIITDGDVRRLVQRTEPAELSKLNAEKMMTTNPISTSPETLAIEALSIMEHRQSQISVLPVVADRRRCVGLIRIHDIVRRGL